MRYIRELFELCFYLDVKPICDESIIVDGRLYCRDNIQCEQEYRAENSRFLWQQYISFLMSGSVNDTL